MGAFVAGGIVVSNCRYGVNYASRGKKALGKAPVDREQQEHDRLKSKADGDKGFGYSRGRDGYGSTI
jgi:hypothetical protein